jgi:protocatechuate 4,5-dioxygenase, alpha chain
LARAAVSNARNRRRETGVAVAYRRSGRGAAVTEIGEETSLSATYRDTPIAGTTVFTGERSRRGYRINKFAMSLTDPANRDAFKADERGYMASFGLTEAEAELVARRDWKGLIEAGGNIYVLLKVGGAVGQNLLQMGAQMRGETFDEFMKTRPGQQGTAVARNG